MINDINIFMTRIYGLILDIFCSVLCFILQLLKQGLTTKKKKKGVTPNQNLSLSLEKLEL